MEAIIGIIPEIVEGITGLFGGTELGSTVVAGFTAILDTLEEDGFAAVQLLMKSYSENDLYNIITSIGGSYPEIFLSRSIKIIGLSPTELLSNLNIIGSKLAKKGIDIASTQGKQLLIDIVHQVGTGIKNNAIPIVASGLAGLGGQAIANKFKDQNDPKIHDYNNYIQNGGDATSNTLSSKS